MKNLPSTPPQRGHDGERRTLALAIILGLAGVGGIGKYVIDRVGQVIGGMNFEITEGPDEEGEEEEMSHTGEERVRESGLDAMVEGPRRETNSKVEEIEDSLERANQLIFEVDVNCAETLQNPFEYDETSRDEKAACDLMATTTEYALCMEDVCDDGDAEVVRQIEAALEQPLRHCADYNITSPREACLEDVEKATKERAFYDCRDEYLAERKLGEAYHDAQTQVFETNMYPIRNLLYKLEQDGNYQPTDEELMEYFNAYNQLRNLRDFDVVLDQLDLGERDEFVQLYGRQMRKIILERGCSDENVDLENLLDQFLPT